MARGGRSDHNDRRAGRLGSGDPGGRVLEHQAVLNGYAQRAPLAMGFEEVVALLGLDALLGRSTTHLSAASDSGWRWVAPCPQPRLLFMDEPLSSLDADSKAEILPYLERPHRTLAIPVLHVSHDADEVRRLADHLLEMRAGRIVTRATDMRATADVHRAAAARRLAGLDPA